MDYGIKIELVKRAHLQRALKAFGDPNASEKDAGKLVAAAVKCFGTMKDLDSCNTCGGRAPVSLDTCPFCGAEAIVEDKLTTAPSGETVSAMEAPSNGTSESNGPTNGAIVRRVRKSTMVKDVPTVAVVTVEEVPKALVADVVLDENLAECRAAKVAGMLAGWRLGNAIRVNVEQGLWKRRKTVEGQQAYTNFDEWCSIELGMTHGNVYELLDVSRDYTEKQVERWGVTNCGLLLRAPAEAKVEIQQKIESGELKTTRDVKAAVRSARVKAGVLGKPRLTGRKRMPQPKKRHAPDKVNVSLATKSQVIPLFTRATIKDEEPKPAKRVADEPVAQFKLSDNVTLLLAVFQNNKGQLVVRMSAKRE